MSFRSGFFNSKNHDKQYYASDISKLFNSLINPGVFGNVGNKFIARPGEGMQVIIPSGMAWFNSTWTLNDSDVVINIDEAPYVANYSRIDGIFLQIFPVDDSGTRDNGAYYMKGTETSATPSKPVPTATDGELYIPICYITVANGTTAITASMIENCVGVTETTPFITGILETVDITELLTQWEAQWNDWLNSEKTDFNTWMTQRESSFDTWFQEMKDQLSEDAAGHLQQEIDELQPVRKRTITNLIDPTLATTTVNGVTITNNGDGTYTLNGTCTTFADVRLTPYGLEHYDECIRLKTGKYKLVGCPSGGGVNKYIIGLVPNDGVSRPTTYSDTGDGYILDHTNENIRYEVKISIYGGYTYDNLLFKPMLTTDLYASYDEFVQYSGDGELNENVSWLYRTFSNALTSLKNTAIAQAVGATGSTFTSVIAKLATIIPRGKVSTLKWTDNALKIVDGWLGARGACSDGVIRSVFEIPEGWYGSHDGVRDLIGITDDKMNALGWLMPSGTADITSNANGINIAQYSAINVNVTSQTSAPIVYNYGAGVRELSVSAGDISKYKACIACNLGASGFDYFYINNGVGSRAAGADNGYFYLTQSGGTFTAHSYRYASSNIAMWLV